MGGVAAHLAFRLGQQAVAHADFFLGADHVDGGRHNCAGDGAGTLGDVAGGFGAGQHGLADILALEAQHFAGYGVFQRRRVAEDAEIARLAGIHQQGGGASATGVGAVALADQHPVVAGSHHPRCIGQGRLIHHQRFGQEGLDQVGWQGGQGAVTQVGITGTRRQAHRLVVIGRGVGAQAGVAVLLFQIQLLARVDQVRVADLLQVHAPQLRPAPGARQVDTRDGPQGVAPLHHVDVGCIRGQFADRHTLARNLLGSGTLARGDGEVLGLGARGGEACHQQGQGRQGGTAADVYADTCRRVSVQLHCNAPPCAGQGSLRWQ